VRKAQEEKILPFMQEDRFMMDFPAPLSEWNYPLRIRQ
jgi:hypothetical protein